MKIIGLTGPSGAGKSTVCSLFEERGIPAIDTDRVYHDLLVPPSPCLDDLVRAFGDGILSADGTLDREKLALRVFGSPDAKADRETLNRITHAYIYRAVVERLDGFRAAGRRAVVIDAPVLLSSPAFCDLCDVIAVVLAPRSLRRARIMERDGISSAAADARLDAQPSDEVFRARADYILTADGDVRDLRGDVDALLRKEELL